MAGKFNDNEFPSIGRAPKGHRGPSLKRHVPSKDGCHAQVPSLKSHCGWRAQDRNQEGKNKPLHPQNSLNPAASPQARPPDTQIGRRHADILEN
jgi:hypothetical protein